MISELVLMGPSSAGKSTVGKLLAEKLSIPFVSLSSEAQEYKHWQEKGFDETVAKQIWDQDGDEGIYHYLKPFEAYTLERGLADYAGSVFELSDVQAVYEEPELFVQVQQILQPYYTVLLLPSSDILESMRILDQRNEQRHQTLINGMEINEHFVRHHSNSDLATYTIYTKGKTADATCAEILQTITPTTSDIILIGPMRAGKSTIGKRLADRLKLPQISMDRLRWDYYKEIGYDRETEKQIREKEGFAGVYRYWKKFDVHAVERILSEHKHCVIDFGAGHSIYENPEDFARVQTLLAPYANVILLLPSPDVEESVRTLRDRFTLKIKGVAMNQHLMEHPSTRTLAKLVVYTQGKTPEETRDEILHHYHFDQSA